MGFSGMPRKNGHLTPQELTYVEVYAATNDRKYAADKAGYKRQMKSSYDKLNNPIILQEIRKVQMARLCNTLVPLALDHFEDTLNDAKAPVRDKTMIGKIVLDHAKHLSDDAENKNLHELTSDEIQAMLADLRREQASRANAARLVNPGIDDSPGGIFD